jgi:hypothetical protein
MSFGPVTRRQYNEILGVPGPPGPPGKDGASGVQVNFAYNTPSPMVLQRLMPGNLEVRAAILITVPFNGDGSTLKLGTSSNPSLIFAAGEVPASDNSLDTFDNSALFSSSSYDYLILTINPVGATQGAGILFYEVV